MIGCSRSRSANAARSSSSSRSASRTASLTSSETLRRSSVSEEGDQQLIAEEFAVLDRAGRLQLPRAHVEALGLEHRVRLRLEADHIRVSPDRDGHPDGSDR